MKKQIRFSLNSGVHFCFDKTYFSYKTLIFTREWHKIKVLPHCNLQAPNSPTSGFSDEALHDSIPQGVLKKWKVKFELLDLP